MIDVTIRANEEDVVIFKQTWKSNEALNSHLRSDHFKVLLGSMKLISIESDIRVNTVVVTKGLETLPQLKSSETRLAASLSGE